MFDRTYCVSHVNWWFDSDCIRNLVDEHNLVRFYTDGLVIARRVETSLRDMPQAPLEDYQPGPFEAPIDESINRELPGTMTLSGRYTCRGNDVHIELAPAGNNDTRIPRFDQKYCGSDTVDSMYLNAGKHVARLLGEDLVFPGGIILRRIA